MQVKSYSDYVNRVSSTIGIDYDSMTDQEQDFLAEYLKTNIDEVWTRGNWLDISPYGEARFVGNGLTYPNDLTQTGYWTGTGVNPIANTIANPCDGRITATQILETAVTSAHKDAQSYSFIPNITYQVSAYLRPNGRNYAYLAVNDGSVTHTSYFNISAGTIGTAANLSQAATIQQCANGFWLCTIYFTSDASAGNGSVAVQLSPDGSTLSYPGVTTSGIYAWGVVLQQTSYASPAALLLPFVQTGENTIDALFCAWRDWPSSTNFPRPQGYTLTPDGAIIVGSSGWTNNYWGYTPPQSFLFGNPVYIYYRILEPNYSGDDFDATLSYVTNDQVLFTNSKGVMNYWKYIATATSTPGQSPDNTPAIWQVIPIPEVFFKYIVYGAYADWLRQDGQFDKAQIADQNAEEQINTEFDRQERQMGWIQPMQVRTHVTSQSRFI